MVIVTPFTGTKRLSKEIKHIESTSKSKKEAEKQKSAITHGKMVLKKRYEKLKKVLKKPVVSKRVLKKEQATVSMGNFNKNYRSESVLGDPNRFFKDEMEETKRSMFFQ